MSERYSNGYFGPMKREAGEIPARTRRCKRGAFLPFQLQMHQGTFAVKRKSLGIPGRRRIVWILKSEDLPVMGTKKPRGFGWCVE